MRLTMNGAKNWPLAILWFKKPQGGIPTVGTPPIGNRMRSDTDLKADQEHALKIPSLSEVPLDKFLFAIADSYIRSHFDKSALLAV